MSKNRYIPFGYRLQSGEITPHVQESDVVAEIFNQYCVGASYKAIAEFLTTNGVPYHDGKAEWDKSMVKRILENRRYMGKCGYPAIISEVYFDTVATIKNQKSQNDTLPASIKSIKKIAACAECGSPFRRTEGTWRCKNIECIPNVHITDEMLLDGIMLTLNELIANPELSNPPTAFENHKSLDVIRLQNYINREFEKSNPNLEFAKRLLYQCAAQKYTDCADVSPQSLTDKIKMALDNVKSLNAFNTAIFDSIVKQVLVEQDGKVRLRLINLKII